MFWPTVTAFNLYGSQDKLVFWKGSQQTTSINMYFHCKFNLTVRHETECVLNQWWGLKLDKCKKLLTARSGVKLCVWNLKLDFRWRITWSPSQSCPAATVRGLVHNNLWHTYFSCWSPENTKAISERTLVKHVTWQHPPPIQKKDCFMVCVWVWERENKKSYKLLVGTFSRGRKLSRRI